MYLFSLIRALDDRSYSTYGFVVWFFQTNNFEIKETKRGALQSRGEYLYVFALLTMLLSVTASLFLSIASLINEFPEGYIFGVAILLAVPLVGAASIMLYNAMISLLVVAILQLKNIGKRILCVVLEAQVVRLRKKYPFKVVAVVGSVGKTSTKLAVAQTLELADKKVQYQQGNYNDRLTVPLVVFGQPLPGLLNMAAWIKILRKNNRIIRKGYQYDVVVLELGTDGPGQLERFAYLLPDITVVTAVAQEHMEFFKTIDAVAEEELSLVNHSKKTLINTDDVIEKYRGSITYTGYGLLHKKADYYIESDSESIDGQNVQCFIHSKNFAQGKVAFLGPQGRKIILAAAAVAHLLEIKSETIDVAITKLQPFAGRMQILPGIKNSILIDDTYNAAPAAVEAALHVLENTKASQRIAVLGSMNELGEYSIEAHKAIGTSIDAAKINLVVTVGTEARDYLAPAAEEQGCEVKTFLNPHEAGLYIKRHLTEGGIVLFKGSQNGVFAEEALKPLLNEKSDESKLVRQSKYWMKQKRKQFKLPR
jgi:UDP-N-acetylmuramoyl-tripeptide--D-alanyl-D-alanine ligase